MKPRMMKRNPRPQSSLAGTLRVAVAATMICIPACLAASAQEPAQEAGHAITAAAVVPQQVRHTGKLAVRAGETVEAEFRIYAAQEGGEPLWAETQQVQVQLDGSYSVLLGAASPAGLPQTVFAGGAARWLGVSVDRSPEQERVLLSSVPYAMKSADAESLAGHAASDFVTQEQLAALAASSAPAAQAVQSATASPEAHPDGSGPITGVGTTNTLALFTGANAIGNANIVQSGTDIGINVATPAATLDVGGTATVRGALSLPSVTTATTGGGSSSQPLELSGSAWSTTIPGPVAQNFALEASATGNNTATPGGTLQLLYSSGSNSLTTTGFYISSNGKVNFASGQTFPNTLANVVANSPLTAVTSAGISTIGLSTGVLEATLNAVYPQLTAANTFHGSQTIDGGLTLTSALTGTTETLTGALNSYGAQSTGTILLKAPNTATASAGYNSPVFMFTGSAFNSGTSAAVNQNFSWQAVVQGNNTATPSANLSLLAGTGNANQSPTGLSISPKGVINFVASQTFPGAGGGSGTITGITTSSPLTGSGISGSVALALNTTALETTLDGIYPQLSAANTFTGSQTITGNANISGSVTAGTGLSAVGDVLVFPYQTATAANSSQSFALLSATASAWNSGTQAAVPQTFGWAALPVNSNTASPSAQLDLVFGAGSAAVNTTGLSIASNGILTFASGQTFPGAGAGSITGITPTSPLTGGGTSGSVPLGLNETTLTSDITPQLETTFNGVYPQLWLSTGNTFAGPLSATEYAENDLDAALTGNAANGSTGVYGNSDVGFGVWGTSYVPVGGASGVFGNMGVTGPTDTSGTYGREVPYQVAGVWGDTAGSANYYTAGVIGTADNADGGSFFNNSASYATVYASNLSTASGVGVSGNAAGTASFGVEGSAATGVLGISTLTTGDPGWGVHGIFNSASKEGTYVAGASGIWADTGVTDTVAFLASADEGNAGLFYNNGSDYDTLLAENDAESSSTATVFETFGDYWGGECIINVSGALGCNGTIGANVQAADSGRTVQTYSVQSAENWFEDAGTVQLVNGVAHVDLEPVFGATVNTGVEYHVFLTPDGDCKGLYVSQKSAGGFDVRELGGGTSSIAFEYRIMAKRTGFETARLVDVTDVLQKQADQRAQRRALAANRPKMQLPNPMPALPGGPVRHLHPMRQPAPKARPVASSTTARPAGAK